MSGMSDTWQLARYHAPQPTKVDEMGKIKPIIYGYDAKVWKRAREMFAIQQFEPDLLGENNLRSWLRAAKRDLVAQQRKRRTTPRSLT